MFTELLQRNLGNYIIIPITLLIILWLLPGFVLRIFSKNKYSDHPLLRIMFSLSVLLVVGSLVLFFNDPKLNCIPLLIGLIFFIKNIWALRRQDFLNKVSKNETKALFIIIIIAMIFLSFSELVADHYLIKNSSFTEVELDRNEDVGEKYLNYEGDYILPLDTTTRYLKGQDGFANKILHIYQVTDRTPYISIIIIPLMIIFGWKFFVFQLISTLLSTLYIIPTYLIARKYLLPKTASLCCIVLALSQFFVTISIFGQSKTITLLFILTSIYIFLEFMDNSNKINSWSYLLFSSFFFAEAVYAHQFSLIYYLASGAIFIWYFFKAKTNKTKKILHKENLKRYFAFLSPVLITMFLWGVFVYTVGTPSKVMENITFSQTWEEAGPSIKEERDLSIQNIKALLITKEFWMNKYYNMLGFFFFNPKPGVTRLFTQNDITIPGSVGAIVFVAFVIGVFSRRLRGQNKLLLFIFVIPFLTLLYNGFYIRMGLMWYALGIVPLIIIFSYSFLEKIEISEKRLVWLTVLIIIENQYVHWQKLRLNYPLRLNDFAHQHTLFVVAIVLLIILLSNIVIALNRTIAR